MSNDPATVMVTGASGYIAGWIVKYLLEAGHTVHATVRNPDKASTVAHLKAMADDSPGELKLFKANLLNKDDFDAPMKGCSVVIHTASPFIMSGYSDAYEALVRPAVEGTRNVLNACNRTESVKRVVVTSSVAAVFGDSSDLEASGKSAFDEDDWNKTSSVNHNPYQFSKVQAEREAWIIKTGQKRWKMVTINPAMVFGPSLTSASKSASIDTLRQLGDGRLKTGVPDLRFGVVDVRDVARAHLLGAFNPDADGRYLLVNKPLSLLAIASILRDRFGDQYPFPKIKIPKTVVWSVGPLMGPITRKFITRNVGKRVAFDNSRSLSLGVEYTPVEQTLQEHFQQAIDDGLIRQRH